jgi:hypothetical protein
MFDPGGGTGGRSSGFLLRQRAINAASGFDTVGFSLSGAVGTLLTTA